MKKKLLVLFTLIGLHDLIVARGGGGHGGGGRGGGFHGGGHGGGRGHGGGYSGHGHGGHGHGGHGHGGYGHGGYGHGYGRGYGYGGWGWGLGGFGLGLALSAPFWWSGPGYYGNTYINDYSGWTFADDGSLSKGEQQTRLERKDLKKALSRLQEDLDDMKNNNASDSDIQQQQSKIDQLKDKMNKIK